MKKHFSMKHCKSLFTEFRCIVSVVVGAPVGCGERAGAQAHEADGTGGRVTAIGHRGDGYTRAGVPRQRERTEREERHVRRLVPLVHQHARHARGVRNVVDQVDGAARACRPERLRVIENRGPARWRQSTPSRHRCCSTSAIRRCRQECSACAASSRWR